MERATLKQLVPEYPCYQRNGYMLDDSMSVSKLTAENLFDIGLFLLQQKYGIGHIPMTNSVSFAWETLTQRAIDKNLAIF